MPGSNLNRPLLSDPGGWRCFSHGTRVKKYLVCLMLCCIRTNGGQQASYR
ncbi:protein of unknown function [Pseudomonas inefficax]|uniref:Uncharacterized protein n=1 Tax=Pseudomonas inefficax TaxID=2078786 RepID=A0AAQ1STE2_9PSED|nr:protein of unknown function [Pseudomonas inefficax]